MADYIKRSAALACCGEYLPGSEHIAEDIRQIPAADVVEIVRCEDCAYWSRFRDSRFDTSRGICFKQGISPNGTYKRFYCAGGKRKEGDNEG